MATLDQLAEQQYKLSQEIDRIITNYKKAPAERKTNLNYVQERLQILEETWAKFEEIDNQIRAVPGSTPYGHNYFVNRTYETTKDNFERFSSHFMEITKSLTQSLTQGSTNASEDYTQNPEAETSNQLGAIAKASKKIPLSPREPTCPQSTNLPPPRSQTYTDDSFELTRVLRTQKQLTELLNRFLQSLTIDNTHTREYYQIKKMTIERYWTQIEELNQTIWGLRDDPTEVGYDINAFIELEERIQDHLIRLAAKLQQPNVSHPPAANGTANTTLSLPKITLPRFDGDYLQWRQFNDLFTEMIHNQPMADCQKMWYLKTNLTGEAEKLIRHFSLSEENYSSALKVLKERYDNPRLLVAALINKLLSQPSQSGENTSAAAIKALHDTTQECLMGLENLKISTNNWDPLLVHLLVRRLDRTTHTLYEQSLDNPRALQTIKHFLEFLETRFQSLEALGSKGRSLDEHKRSNTSKYTSMTLTAPQCVMCKANHPLYTCKSFRDLNTNNRVNILRENNLCINCFRGGHTAFNCTLRGCSICRKKHNTLVHFGESTPRMPQKADTNTKPQSTISHSKDQVALTTSATTLSRPRQGYVLLGTARIRLTSLQGKTVECRAILDSGSQVNLVTERIIKKLGLNPVHDSLLIQGIGHNTQQSQRRTNILLQSRITGFSTQVEAFVLKQIISPQPTQPISIDTWNIPQNIPLADPLFNRTDHIDMLLGAEFYHQLLSVGQIKLAKGLPILQNTVLGWILAGRIEDTSMTQAACGIGIEEVHHLDQTIERFWRIEDAEGTQVELTRAEKQCENHFNQTTTRNKEGRFVVRLPFIEDPAKLGDSKTVATRRFLSLERRLDKDVSLRRQYEEFMNEYMNLNHMEEIDINSVPSPNYFLPHHCVLKPDSSTTKLRVVFDASAKSASNTSLNDILHTGPTVQDDLFAILVRFRLPRYVFTADIQKMYRQIEMHKEDQKFQLILWRRAPSEPIRCYQLKTVTYGTRPAPYLATKCLQRLAEEGSTKYPLGAEVLKSNFYVDDVITGADSLSTLIEIQRQLRSLLADAGFNLRKWCSNHPWLLRDIKAEDQEVQIDFKDDTMDQVKTLGLTWLPKSDEFRVKVNWSSEVRITKRTVSSDIARLFDPLGIMGPVIVTAKIFLQQLWQLKLDWDAALPMALHTKWIQFRDNLKDLDTIKFGRHVCSNDPKNIQIHAFADASEDAYGAAIYVRSTSKEGIVIVRLLCSKSRVAPIKRLTLPRLELCAAKLAVELTNRVKNNMNLNEARTYFWTDSEIVLAWINSESASFQTFVANRVSYIQRLSIPNQWRHVRSKENPADVLSRGINPKKLAECNQWFYGPTYLHGKESLWPLPYNKGSNMIDSNLEKKKSSFTLAAAVNQDTTDHFLDRINHKNSFRRLQRITAYMLRFIEGTRAPSARSVQTLPLSTQELDKSLKIILRIIQEDEFKDDIAQLRKYREVHKTSSLSSLAPFLDNEGVLRVGGRLEASELAYEAKHPALLSYSHPFTKMLMEEVHKENMHIGPQALLAIMRQRYWPIKGKTLARSIVQHCVRCNKARPKMLTQMMGNLPAARVQPARPFINTGVDFCGPIWVHFRLRGKRPHKAYVAVFCCFATKAVHFEIVSDLTTEAFIGALKRFMGRRGRCQHLYCDNATNFVGANNQLLELESAIYSTKATEQIKNACSNRNIQFHFIPPRTPHFGGLWEAAVKSAKHLLQRSVASVSLTYEELETVMIEIEAILNSRPLTPLSDNPNDLTALTPGHFLIGEPLTTSIEPNAEPTKTNLLTRWKLVTHIKSEFWRRWSSEYLSELQHRLKWKQRCENVDPGTIVIIKEDNVPVMKWPLGRIIQTIKGDDGCVRVADVKTSTGTLRRPIHRLAPLPVEQDCTNIEANEHSTNPTSVETQVNHRGSLPRRSSNESQERPRKKRKQGYGSAIVSLLMVCMVLLPAKGEPVEITRFNNQVGIHFENMGTVKLTSSEWDIVAYYDLKPYWQEYSMFLKGTETLQDVCTRIQDPHKEVCEPIVNQLMHLKDELRKDNLLLGTSYRRIKRGALNVIGNIANSLFGVLDSEYAKEMSNTIHKVNKNEEHLLTLLKNQTSIIDSTVNIIKKDQLAVEEKFKALDTHLSKIIGRLERIENDTFLETLIHTFMALSIQMTMLAANLNRIQSVIVDVITDAHDRKLNPLILSPQRFMEEISNIKSHLPANLELPVDKDNIPQFYKSSVAQGCIINNHIIFRIKLPLVNQDSYDLFQLHPIPVRQNNTILAIKPTQPYLAINAHRDQYYPLSEAELAKCTNIENSTYLCEQNHPVYHKGATISACEVGLLNSIPPSELCNLFEIKTRPIWIQLKHSNQWIFAMDTVTPINLVCGRRTVAISLEGVGLLTLQPDCTIKYDLLTIRGRYRYPSNIELSYTKLGTMPEVAVPTTVPPSPFEFKHYNSSAAELQGLRQLLESQKAAGLPETLDTHIIHLHTVAYLGLLLAVCVIIWLAWSSRSKICRRQVSFPVPAPRQPRKISLPAEA